MPAIDVWTPDCDWPYVPTGDGKTCKENPEPTHFLLQNVSIIAPLFRMGFWYGYSKDQFVRKAVPSFDAVVEVCVISKTLRDDRRHLGMRASKAATLVTRLIFDLQYALLHGPTKERMEIISPVRIQSVLNALKRLKSPPEGLAEHLQRLAELHGQLEYV